MINPFNPFWILLNSIMVVAVALLVGSILPGVERKIQARIQQRIGPSILTPGFWTLFKFAYKKKVMPNSPMPRLYTALLPTSIILVLFMLLFTTPSFMALFPAGNVKHLSATLPPSMWLTALGFSSIFGVLGLLKVEELMYVFMGSLSQSILSVGMPYPDIASGAKIRGLRRDYVEQHSAVRAFKMIGVGSFPLYITLLVPFAMAGSIFVEDVIKLQNPGWSLYAALDTSIRVLPKHPNLFTVPGALAAFVYFIGFMILLNEKPFNIMKAKADVVEGPLLEYAALSRTFVYILREVLLFSLSSIFVSFFLGVPLDPSNPMLLVLHVLLCFPLVIGSAILSAFTPILTFKQIYPISFTTSAIGVLALLLAIVT